MLKNQTKLRDLLFSPMDISLLVYFRIIFGTVMLWEVFRYFDHGWIYRYWIDPSFHFSYYGFSWVQPWPGDLMILHFVGLGILATCIMIGFKYRICAILFFLGFAHVFLSDQATYLNHFYLICWISFLMIFLPANRAFSIGALRNKKIKTDVIPGWPIWLLRAQLGIVYFFGGIAKINSDWLHGEPMRMWLAQRTDFPIIGGFFTDEFTVYSFSYGALLIDLLITPFLLYRKTRIPAFCIVTVFHVMNHFLFSIGIFPWFMIFATLLFFSPDWPRRFANFVSKNPNEKPKIASFVDPNKDTQHYLDRYYKEKKYKN